MHLAWAKGGTATILTAHDDAVTLRSTIPSPPGSRLDATLLADAPSGAPALGLKVKIHTSKLEADGSFALKGRILEATRALRERVALLAASSFTPTAR